jgi:hypothetical protein
MKWSSFTNAEFVDFAKQHNGGSGREEQGSYTVLKSLKSLTSSPWKVLRLGKANEIVLKSLEICQTSCENK